MISDPPGFAHADRYHLQVYEYMIERGKHEGAYEEGVSADRHIGDYRY